MRLKVRHETVYRYDFPASYSVQYVRLTPTSNPSQRVLSWRLSAPGKVRETVDAFGNTTHLVVVDKPHDELRIGIVGEVESNDTGGVWPTTTEPQPADIFLRPTALSLADAQLAKFAGRFEKKVENDRLGGLEAMMHGVRDRVSYIKGKTHVGTTAAEAWKASAGVCQDHAHIFIACCRALGVPARYVSGYLFTSSRNNEMASHAWAEVWIDDKGWVGLDVTNGVLTHAHHVRLAIGLDYLDASPVRGMRRGGGNERMHVRVFVTDGQPENEPAPRNDRPQQQQAQQQQ